MLNIQEAIRSLIQKELNKNTQGLDFGVSLYSVKTNDLLENTLPVGDTYATQQKRFIPVLIEEISGEYADLQNLTASEVFINLSLLIPVDNQDFNNIVIEETYQKVALALDELRIRTNARKLPLGEPIFQKEPDYRLKVLNETNMLSSDFIKFSFSIFENVNKTFVRDNGLFEVELLNNKIRLNLFGQFVEHPFQVGTRYSVEILKETSETVTVKISGGNLNDTVETLNIVGLEYNDITFGGLVMAFSEITLGTNSNSLSLKLNDFQDYQPVIGNISDLDLSQTTKVYTIGDVGTIVFGYSIPNPTTNQFTMGNGLNYQQFELNMTGFVTDTVFVGNEVRYFLDNVEIFPFFRDETFVSETDPSQVVGQQITKHTAVQSILGREYSFYYKNQTKLTDLAKKITSEEPNPNEVFRFRIEYPFFTREYFVIITQGSLGISNNQPISISLKFDLASNILVGDLPEPTPTTPLPEPTPTPPPLLTTASPGLSINTNIATETAFPNVSFNITNNDNSIAVVYISRTPNPSVSQSEFSISLTPSGQSGSTVVRSYFQLFGENIGEDVPEVIYARALAINKNISTQTELSFTSAARPITNSPTLVLTNATPTSFVLTLTNNEPGVVDTWYTLDETVAAQVTPGESGWEFAGTLNPSEITNEIQITGLTPGQFINLSYAATSEDKIPSPVKTESFSLPEPTPTPRQTSNPELLLVEAELGEESAQFRLKNNDALPAELFYTLDENVALNDDLGQGGWISAGITFDGTFNPIIPSMSFSDAVILTGLTPSTTISVYIGAIATDMFPSDIVEEQFTTLSPPPAFTASAAVFRSVVGNWFITVPVDWEVFDTETNSLFDSGTTNLSVDASTDLINNIPIFANFKVTAPTSIFEGGETYNFVRWSLNSISQTDGQNILEITSVTDDIFLAATYEKV